jgi:hypothetical protein
MPDGLFSVWFQTSPAVLTEKIVVGLGLAMGLANLRSRKKIAEKTHAGRGQETKWEIQVKIRANASARPLKARFASCPSFPGNFGKRQQTL